MLFRLAGSMEKSLRVMRGLEADWVTKLASTACVTNLRRRREIFKSEALKRWHSDMELAVVSVRCPRKRTFVPLPFEVCTRARAVDEFCRQVSFCIVDNTFPMSNHNTPLVFSVLDMHWTRSLSVFAQYKANK